MKMEILVSQESSYSFLSDYDSDILGPKYNISFRCYEQLSKWLISTKVWLSKPSKGQHYAHSCS